MRTSTLEVTEHGPITRIRMTAKVAGIWRHEMSAYRVGDTLVDCGARNTAPDLLEYLRSHRVAKVVATHHHEDHAGAGALLTRELGIRVYAPEGALPILAEGARIPLYRRVVLSRPEPYVAVALGAEVDCGGCTLEVIPTPGHAFDHVCFFERENGWLFTGDLFVHERVQVLRGIESVYEHIASLRRVAALEPRLLVCAHSGFTSDGAAALRRKIEYWEDLADRAWALRRRGMGPGRITRELLGREGSLTYLTLGDYSKKKLVRGLLGED